MVLVRHPWQQRPDCTETTRTSSCLTVRRATGATHITLHSMFRKLRPHTARAMDYDGFTPMTWSTWVLLMEEME